MAADDAVQENHLRTERTARYYTLGAAEAEEVWFVLHGYGQLAGYFIRPFAPLAGEGRLIVAPEALSRFYLRDTGGRIGASWMTSADRKREMEDYVRYLDRLHDHLFERSGRAGRRVHLLGFSQGTATACRWAAWGKAAPERLTLWAGEVPPDLDPETLRGPVLTLVLGTEDEYITRERIEQQQARLDRHGLPYRLLPFKGGHHFHAETLRALAGG